MSAERQIMSGFTPAAICSSEDPAQGGDVVVQLGGLPRHAMGSGEDSTGPDASRAGMDGGVFLPIRRSIRKAMLISCAAPGAPASPV